MAQNASQELSQEGDQSSLFYVARALMELQASHGAARRVMGVGPAAAAVRSIMSRMRSELGADAPPPAASEQGIDTMFIMDREVVSSSCCHTLAHRAAAALGLQRATCLTCLRRVKRMRCQATLVHSRAKLAGICWSFQCSTQGSSFTLVQHTVCGARLTGVAELVQVDLVTPMCTQLTYEGLIDEVFGIKNGVVQLELGADGASLCSAQLGPGCLSQWGAAVLPVYRT